MYQKRDSRRIEGFRDRELQSEGDIIHNDLGIERKRELQRVAGRKREKVEGGFLSLGYVKLLGYVPYLM